jgi:hypothetical protein
MKRIVFVIILFISICAFGVDTKLTDLTVNATPASECLIYIVSDPCGTPASNKVTLKQLYEQISITTDNIKDATVLSTTSINTYASLADFVSDATLVSLTGIDTYSELNAVLTDSTLVSTTAIANYAALNSFIGDATLISLTGMDTYAELNAILTDSTILSPTTIATFASLDHFVADKDLVNKADGAIWLGVHDFGGATSIEIVNGTDPDVDALGEVSFDTDGGNETSDTAFRGWDGYAQFVVAKQLRHLQATLISPADIPHPDLIPIWANNTGYTFNIIEIDGYTDASNVHFEIDKTASLDNFTAPTLLNAMVTGANQDSVSCVSDTTLTVSTVEANKVITMTYDANDDPNYLKVTITGWFNADVD